MYILGNGYYSYSDFFWPLSKNFYPTSAFSYGIGLSTPFSGTYAPLLYTDDVVSWPWLILRIIFTSNINVEKSLVIYTFIVILILSYLFSEVLINYLENRTGETLNFLKRELLCFFIVILIFSNFTMMNYTVDGGTFTDSIIFILIAIEILLAISPGSDLRYSSMIGALLSLSLFLDPDYFVLSVIAILIVMLASRIVYKTPIIRRFSFSLLLSLPVLVYLFYLLSITSSSLGGVAYSRPFNLTYFIDYSSHMSPWRSLMLIGHNWSTLTFAPPSILFSKGNISQVRYLGSGPPQVLLPPGIVTTLWMACIAIIPILAFASLYFRRTRRIAIPVVACLLSFFAITQFHYSSFLLDLLLQISSLPLIGSYIGTSFGLPGHFMDIMAITYVILLPIFLFNIMIGRDNSIEIYRKKEFKFIKKKLSSWYSAIYRKRKVIIVLLAFTVVIFANWQAFNGSYYPSRSSWGTLPGNGIPNKGPFTPFNFPKGTQVAYNFLANQNGAFNQYWPTGPSVPSPQPHQIPSNVQGGAEYLFSDHLINDGISFLRSNNVSFVTVENESAIDLMNTWGNMSYSSVVSCLISTGQFSYAFNTTNITILKLKNPSPIAEKNSYLFSLGALNDEQSTLYGFLPTLLKANFSLLSKNFEYPTIDINSLNSSINALSPAYLLYLSMSPQIVKFQNLTFNVNPSSQENIGTSNFTIVNWRSNSTISVVSGNSTISVVSGNQSGLFSISYNGAMTSPSGGIYLKDHNMTSYTLGLQFDAKTTGNLTPSLTFLSYGNKSASMYKSVSVPISRTFNRYSYSVTIPSHSYYADFRIWGSGNGSISLKNLGFSLGSLQTNYSTPFGSDLALNKLNLTFPKGINNSYLMFRGIGTINGNNVSSLNHDSWYHISSTNYFNISGKIQIIGAVVSNRNIMDYTTHSISTDISYFSGLIYTTSSSAYKAIPTVWGMSVFVDTTDINGTFSVSNETLINVAYPILLALIGFEIYLFKRKRKTMF